MPRATAADDDASCSLSADASSFRFEGTRRLYGDARFAALADAHVVVLGMGGVGSWAVEALARSGVGALTLVDLDFVCVTNVNRQILAADSSVGDAKAEVMRARVLDINPECDVRVVNDFVTERNVEAVLGIAPIGAGSGKSVDYVLDAIDGENDKAAVVACCVHHHIPVLVTGGAGGIDHLGDIVVEDLANATFNRLLQRVRRLLRREYAFPRGGEGAFPGKKRNKKDGKFGVSAVYARENANHFRQSPGTKGRGGIGCDGVGGSAVFVTGALGFKAASHIALRLMEAGADGGDDDAGKKTAGRPTAAGWRSKPSDQPVEKTTLPLRLPSGSTCSQVPSSAGKRVRDRKRMMNIPPPEMRPSSATPTYWVGTKTRKPSAVVVLHRPSEVPTLRVASRRAAAWSRSALRRSA